MNSTLKAIGVLAPQLSGDYFGTLLAGIHAITRQYSPRLIAVQGTPEEVVRARLALDEVAGWVVINTVSGIELLARTGVPLVTIGAQAAHIPAVFPDNLGGVRAVVAHLLGHGHRQIAFVGELGHEDVKQRYQGYQAGLAEHGIALDPALVLAVPDGSEASGAAAVAQLLANAPSCTAVVAATDETALGVLAAAQAAGRRIPIDLAVVGFDDIILAHSATPPLSTVRLPIRELGSTAAELLLAQIEAAAPPAGATYVPTALIPRRSCGCNLSAAALVPLAGLAGQGWREALARHLAQLAQYPLPLDPHATLDAIWPGGQVLIDALQAALADTEAIGATEIHQAWQQLVERTGSLEQLLIVLAAIEDASAHQATLAQADPGLAMRLRALFTTMRLEMLRARMAIETNFIRSYSALVAQSYAISRSLLTAELGAVEQLAWLANMPVSCGYLGLWAEALRGEQATLVLAGAYHRSGQGDPAARVGSHYQPEHFPAEHWLPASVRETGSEIALVLPIQTANRNWGVLMLAGSVEYLRAAGNYDVLSAIAALLGSALDRDTLRQTLHNANERERGLSNIVREIGSPVIPLLPGVLLIPLVGAIDSVRAQQIIEAILAGVSSQQATQVLLDVSGVPLVDTQVAGSLVQATQAARLLGAQVTLIGVRPEIAQSIVSLGGVELLQLMAQPTLAAALQSLLHRRGISLANE